MGAMEDMVDTALVAMEHTTLATAMVVMARGLQTLRLMPTMAMEDMVDTVLAAMEPTTLATDMGAMAKGLLTLRLMPTTVMEAMVDTALVTPLAMGLATATAVMAKGLLTPRPMPTMAMEDMADTDSAMEDMVMVVLDMDMASKHRSQLGCQELPRLMQGTATTNFVSRKLE